MKRILYIFFRILLGLSLISLGVKNLQNLSSTENSIVKSLDFWNKNVKGQEKVFDALKRYTNQIALSYTYSLGLAGLLVILGVKGSSFYVLTFILLEAALVNSPAMKLDDKVINHYVKILALFGGVMNS